MKPRESKCHLAEQQLADMQVCGETNAFNFADKQS